VCIVVSWIVCRVIAVCASCGHLMCISCLCVCGAVYLLDWVLCICCTVGIDFLL
jgi:hypothetical protein